MDRRQKIEQEVEKTLQCFDQVESLKSNPFFFTRVQARIASLSRAETRSKGFELGLGVLKPALLVMLVAFNIVTVAVFLRADNHEGYDRGELVEAFGQEYALDQSQYDVLSIE